MHTFKGVRSKERMEERRKMKEKKFKKDEESWVCRGEVDLGRVGGGSEYDQNTLCELLKELIIFLSVAEAFVKLDRTG